MPASSSESKIPRKTFPPSDGLQICAIHFFLLLTTPLNREAEPGLSDGIGGRCMGTSLRSSGHGLGFSRFFLFFGCFSSLRSASCCSSKSLRAAPAATPCACMVPEFSTHVLENKSWWRKGLGCDCDCDPASDRGRGPGCDRECDRSCGCEVPWYW